MRAYLAGGTAEDLRHNVAALVQGSVAPTMGEFVEATFKADVAVKIAPNEPWGYSARCLVALRIGDRDLLDGCLTDLKRVAPDHPETKRILAMAHAGEPPFAIAGRWLLVLALLGTLAHAIWRSRRAAPSSGSRMAARVFLCCLAFAAATAGAARAEAPANLSGVDINDANPEASLPSLDQQLKDPLRFGYILQDMLANAQAATKRGDHETAARYYRALAKAVPSTAYAPGQLCQTLATLGDAAGALVACRDAVTKDGVTVADYARLVELIVSTPDSLSKDSRAELQAIAAHVSSQKEAGLEGERLRCKIATRLHDVPMLEACTTALVNGAAGDAVTISFQWSLAMEKHDFSAAKNIVEHARQLGLGPKTIETMQEATTLLRRKWLARVAVWIVGSAFAMFLLAVGARRFGLPRRRVVV